VIDIVPKYKDWFLLKYLKIFKSLVRYRFKNNYVENGLFIINHYINHSSWFLKC